MPGGHPVEFLSLSGKLGAQVRATVHSFGPLLLGKVLDLNDTQTSILSLDLQVLRRQPAAAARPGGPTHDAAASSARTPARPCWPSTAACRRRIGRRPPAVDRHPRAGGRRRLLRRAGVRRRGPAPDRRPDGKGIVSVLELSDVMDKPRLFSTFMLWMLAQLYHDAAGDRATCPKPKLCFFFDEAHLLFDDASDAADGADRADGAADPLEGRRRLLRDPGARPTSQLGPGAAGEPGASTRCAPSRRRTPTTCARPARTFPMSTSTTCEKVITALGHRRGTRDGPDPAEASRPRSRRPGSSRRTRSMDALDAASLPGPVATGGVHGQVRPRRSTARAPTRSSPPGSRRGPSRARPTRPAPIRTPPRRPSS